jgi:multidrug transporter EmrE-like cation transporter
MEADAPCDALCLPLPTAAQPIRMINLFLIFAQSLLGILGDVFIKLAGERTPAHLGWLGLGTLAYILTVPGWLLLMRSVPLLAVGLLYAVSTIFLLAVIGVIGFHEHLSALEATGLVLAVLALVAFRRFL